MMTNIYGFGAYIMYIINTYIYISFNYSISSFNNYTYIYTTYYFIT